MLDPILPPHTDNEPVLAAQTALLEEVREKMRLLIAGEVEYVDHPVRSTLPCIIDDLQGLMLDLEDLAQSEYPDGPFRSATSRLADIEAAMVAYGSANTTWQLIHDFLVLIYGRINDLVLPAFSRPSLTTYFGRLCPNTYEPTAGVRASLLRHLTYAIGLAYTSCKRAFGQPMAANRLTLDFLCTLRI